MRNREYDRTSPHVTRRERIAFAAILAVALVVRLYYLHELRADVLFDHPPLDEERYVAEAQRLAREGFGGPRPFWQPPGILFLLAATFRVFGDGLFVPRLLQALAGTFTCALIWMLARRLFGPRVAIASGAVVALHGLLVFSGAELLPATWAALFDLAAIVLLLDASKSILRAAAAGGLLGMAALFTPLVLPFSLVIAVALFRTREQRGVPWVFAAMVLFAVIPVTILNFVCSGEVVLIATNGGLNFFLGNNERYFDTLAIRPGPHWTELTQAPWREARISGPAAESSWFFGRGLAFWAAHPIDALGLIFRKLWLFFHAVEIPRDTDLYAVRSESRVLGLLTGPRGAAWPDGILMPLAIVGLWTARWAARTGERPRLLLPLAFIASQAVGYALFFASARYRVPCIPLLVMFAIASLAAIARSGPRVRVACIACAVALGVVCALPAREAMLSFPAERDLYRGLAHRRRGDSDRALEQFRRAAEAGSNDPRPWTEAGNELAAAGRSLEAADAWERAAACDAWDLQPGRRAADVRARSGDWAGAIRVLEANLMAKKRPAPEYAVEHVKLMAIHLDSGAPEAALRALRTALEVNPSYARSHGREVARTRRATISAPTFWTAFDTLVSTVATP